MASDLTSPLILLAFALAAHGIILLNDGLYWDGWNIDSWQRRKDWHTLKRFFSEVGMPFLYYQHKFIALLPQRVVFYRALALASTYVSSLAIYLTAVNFGLLGVPEALALSLLYLAYTGYHMNVDTMVGFQYTLPTALFYCAVLAAFHAHGQTGQWALALHACAMLLFLVSFNANSLLVYYFGFLGLSLWHQAGGDIARLATIELIAGNVLYAVLPFAYWVLKEKLSPRHGYYENYNRIPSGFRRFASRIFIEECMAVFRYGFEAAITLPIRFAFSNGRALVTIFVSLCIYLLIEAVWGKPSVALTRSESFTLLCFGLVLLILAGLPYVLVKQPISDHGWATKNSMLFHLPVSMVLLGLLTTLVPDFALVVQILIVFLLASWAYNVRTYLYYLAAYVKDRSWLFQLKRVQGIEAFSLFQVIDRHWLKADLRNREQDYASSYLHSMFDWLWGGRPSRFGIREFDPRGPYTASEVATAIENTTLSYSMKEVNRSGRQARIIIKGGNGMSFLGIALRYIMARLPGSDANRMNALLSAVTEVEFGALN